MTLSLTPLTPDFGCEVLGLDASRSVAPDAFTAMLKALYTYSLIVLRNQQLDPEQLEQFGALFGTPIPHVEEDLRFKEAKGVMSLSNADGRPERQRNGGAFWHTDLVFTETPSSFTMLNAVAVPASGGDTLFADQVGALQDLPEPLHDMARRVEIGHCYEGRTDGSMPTVFHPLIRKHPVSGRKALYGAAATGICARGIAEDAQQSFLEQLADHATSSRFQYAHRYQPNDLVIWDNAVTLHSGPILQEARSPDDVRIMHRVSVHGWPDAPGH